MLGVASKTTVRVRYADTDKMSVAYHANYIIWFEVGRAEFFRELEMPFPRFEEQGLGMYVIEVSCRYRRPALYDDEVVVVTEAEHMSSHAIRFRYRMYREDTLLADGKSIHVFLDKEGKMADVGKYAILTRLRDMINNSSQEKQPSAE